MRVVGTRIPTTGEDRKIYSTVDSTATAGQTVFAVNYDEGKVACWLNGIRLVQGQDFTYTASGVGSQIALTSGIVANDYVEVVGYQGIYSGNALVEDRFVVGTNSTGSGGAYNGSAGNHTTVFPVANNTGDLVCVYRNGIKLVHTTDFTVQPTASTVTLQSASNTADEITVHVIGILQHSNFVPVTGGTFTGTVAHTGTLNVSGGTLTTSTAQKDAIVDGSTAIARSGNNLTFAGNATVTGDLTVDTNTLKVDSGNNRVGIGASPSFAPLELKQSNTTYGFLIEASGNDAWIRLHHNDNVGILETTYNSSAGHKPLTFKTGGAERLRIDTSGNIASSTTGKFQQKGAFMQSSTHQALVLGS